MIKNIRIGEEAIIKPMTRTRDTRKCMLKRNKHITADMTRDMSGNDDNRHEFEQRHDQGHEQKQRHVL
jgi:hypothetical protein